MSKEITGYDLSRDWFDFCFGNPEKISPNHTAIYFFIIEHCNRLGWKEKFGLPMQMTMDAVGIKNYKTFSKAFNDLVDWGFVKMLEKSTNQYSANIVALVKNTKAHTKALSKAMLKHSQKQVHGIVGIDKPITNNQEQESKGEVLPAPDLKNSNLFRKPNVPTKEKVWEVFHRNGGTKEMSEKFYETNEAVGWFYKGSPITNFSNLVPGYIRSWKENTKTASVKNDYSFL